MDEESFVCKVRFNKNALDGVEVLEGDEKRCREFLRSRKMDELKTKSASVEVLKEGERKGALENE